MGEIHTQPTYPKGITFEQVWAALMEDREQMKESRAEYERQRAEAERQRKEEQEEKDRQRAEAERQRKEEQEEKDRQRAEAERQRKEEQEEAKTEFDRKLEISRADFDRQMKEIGKRLGDFTNSFGEVVECMIAPNLQEKFNDFGYDFQEASTRHKIRDKKNNIRFEIDVYLQNGDTAMLVEIKADLTISDINRHITRLEKNAKVCRHPR